MKIGRRNPELRALIRGAAERTGLPVWKVAEMMNGAAFGMARGMDAPRIVHQRMAALVDHVFGVDTAARLRRAT
jgi:hypothetical protein